MTLVKRIRKGKEIEEDSDLVIECVCFTCRNLLIFPYCIAFPDGKGIPREIQKGDHDHSIPINGDDGILYKPRRDFYDE